MAARETLFDLFGDFTATWPATEIREHTGIPGPGSAVPDPSNWLGALNNAVQVDGVRTGAADGRVSVEAQLTLPPGLPSSYPEGWPFSFLSMPDVLFQVLPISGAGKSIRLFASVSDMGAEVVLEGVPVEIRLPGGLVQPKPQTTEPAAPTAAVEKGSFSAGSLDDLKIVYRQTDPTSIFVHVRIHATEEGHFEVMPSVPISFESCVFSGLPCIAVHDFRLIPSPKLAPDEFEWLRHEVTPWAPSLSGPVDGLFAIRSLDLDPASPPIRDTIDWLHGRSKPGPAIGSGGGSGGSGGSGGGGSGGSGGGSGSAKADPSTEFVLADTVVPFFSPWVIPIPRHITIGLRRRVLDPTDAHETFAFDHAPINAQISSDPAVNLIVESFFYKSEPLASISTDLGLTFSAGIAIGEGTKASTGFSIELGDHYTPRIGYMREFLPSGDPAPGSGVFETLNKALHFELAGTVIVDVMAIRIGYSLGRALGEGASFKDSAELTVDLWVSMPPTGSDKSPVKLRSLSGERVRFAIEGLGWRQGSFHLEGIAFPDGVIAMFGMFQIIIEEIGIVAEQGASYISFSAGLVISPPGGFTGGVGVRRLRFRVAGDTSQRSWKLDGFFILLRSPAVQIEAGGYYTDTTVSGTRVRELGLTGTVGFGLSGVQWVFGLDLITGHRTSASEDFRYLMVQVFFRGSIPISWFELRGARVLFADNMRPKLKPDDPSSRELRYYNWYKQSDPTTVPGDRRLTVWQAENHAWAFGIGVGASLAQLGKLIELDVFVLGMDGPAEGGLLVVANVLLASSTTPVAFVAIQWDGKHDRFSLLAGVDLKLSTFVKSIPEWLDSIAKLTGTLFISNDPATFAIGRLNDQRTWLSITFSWDVWLRTYVQFGICVEIVEGPEGPKGFGLVARVEGGINAGVIRVVYFAGIVVMVEVFSSGSADFATSITIEAGIKIVLFGFLNFGIRAGVAFHVVGAHPSRGDLSAEFDLETPWFLPDVTWTLQVAFGELAPADLATAVQPLRSSAGEGEATRKAQALHIERAKAGWDGEGAAPVYSINELRAPAADEEARLASFAADANVEPIPTDSKVPIEWSVSVNDKLGIGSSADIAPNLGNQKSSDLTLTYDLVGLAVRRRPRFGTSRPWGTLEERIELEADFTDPGGVALSGSFGPGELNKWWDTEVKNAGKTATKRLLINSKVPFDFATKNPVSDEILVGANPEWPCCGGKRRGYQSMLHQLSFRNQQLGSRIEGPRTFSKSNSRLRFLRPARIASGVAGGLPATATVAAVDIGMPGPFLRIDLDEDAAFVALRLLWPRGSFPLSIVAWDGEGNEVASRELAAGPGVFENVVLSGQGPIRRVEARLVFSPSAGAGLQASALTHMKQAPRVMVDWAAYIGLDDYLDGLIAEAGCESGGERFGNAYSGAGHLFFLPNHEYEIKVTTRVTTAHPTVAPESVDVDEWIYFKTKGLPGLNAVERVGEEVEPYVASAYAGGRGVLYRNEPVTLAFNEDYQVAVPVESRPAGSSAEATQLLRLKLTARPQTAPAGGTPYTAASADWLTEHRVSPLVEFPDWPWRGVESAGELRANRMRSTDPALHRLAELTQRPEVDCGLSDPRETIGSALVAPPQGTSDEAEPPHELWPGSTTLLATVRVDGSGFVDRQTFAAGDQTAFDQLEDGGAGGGWSVADGHLVVGASTNRRYAVFGETDWDHLTIAVSAESDAAAFGVGTGLPSGAPSEGLFAMVETTGSGRRLVVYRREGGGLSEVEHADLPSPADAAAPISLEVTSFDDRLRARVGEVTVWAERGEIREGRACLVTHGAARFASLSVHGLDMFSFPVPVSRFASFEDHVGSFDGQLDTIAPDALGAGTTTGTVAGLWAATAAEVGGLMRPDADGAARQALFDRWVAELGLPLKDDVTKLELSALTAAGNTTAFLLESPEPLDFTAEVKPTLTHRVASETPWVPPWAHPTATEISPGRLGLPRRPELPRRPGLREEIRALDGTRGELLGSAEREIERGAIDGPIVRFPHKPPHHVVWTDEPVELAVLQNREGTRALLIPIASGSATNLEHTTYRLTLTLDRDRWATTEPTDEVNHCHAEATIELSL